MPARYGRRAALATLVALLGIGGGLESTAVASGAQPARADSLPSRTRPARPRSVAPRDPPLQTGTGSAGLEAAEAPAGSPAAETDPLVSNGLGSPLCKGALGAGELSASESRNCVTSGFVAAAAPTGDYGIDVHIDTGVLGVSSGGLLSAVQDLFVTPLWMALVWIVHALVVMLEWCFTVDLLDSAAATGIGRGLLQAQAAFTEPWLATVLAIASVLAVYNGLIRRRVAETLGHSALMGAMIVGGLWVIANPTGTVGALAAWANRASLGTLAVAARGTPSGPAGVLAQSMDTVFAAVIEAPWCYLEFGNVEWCRNPARLDPSLRAGGLRIAAQELAAIGCHSELTSTPPCVAPGTGAARALEHSAQLLREAHSNGALFLALPANGPARNSINEQGSLLRVLCASSEATNCRGPTAAEAEFRTGGQTMSRVGGLLLIVAGGLGMMLLLGSLALRLLAAAVFSLLYLLLAPAIVLAPALGEGGRALFRRWGARLLGAVVAKLLLSFLLGAILAVLTILANLNALGWWTQWLLMSAFWWGAYLRRHEALGVAEGALGRERIERRPTLRRIANPLEWRRGLTLARRAKAKRPAPAPALAHRRPAGRAAPAATGAAEGASALESARRSLEHEHRDARARLDAAPGLEQHQSARRAQLGRVQRAHAVALADGDARRGAELAQRGARIERQLTREQEELARARTIAFGADHGRRRTAGSTESPEERARFLDAQAALAPAARARSAGERRDYRRLAGLAGYGGSEYERLDPRAQRAARLQIDRELASHRERMTRARNLAMPTSGPSRARADHPSAAVPDTSRTVGPRRTPPSDRSSVMQDAREVAAGRKRQLGRDRS